MIDELESRFAPAWALRLALAVFVGAWIFGPYELRSAVPIWIPFVIVLGLEIHFLYSALRHTDERARDRLPQAVDRGELGYEGGTTDELLLVDDGDRELWIPYEGETGDELEELIADAREWAEEDEGSGEVEPVQRRSARSALRRFATGLGVIALLGLAVWFIEGRTGWSSVDGDARLEAAQRFSQEASQIAGKQVTIRCDESRDYVGFVQHSDGVAQVGGDRAYLTPEICHDLYRLAFQDEVSGAQTGRAIAVLAHEAWHLRGEADESTTECFAVQSGVGLGVRLGLSEDRARQLMRQQLAENALRVGSTAEYRVSPDCRDGTSLDLRPGDSRFP